MNQGRRVVSIRSVPGDIVETVSTISKIAGTKARSIENLLSLLKLSLEIRESVKKGEIGISQGYLFAANFENPGLMTVFEGVLANPVTNRRLTELLKKAKTNVS
jgi:hypothetical protein